MTSLGVPCQRQAGGRCGQECVFVEGGYWHNGAPWSSQQLLYHHLPTILPHNLGAHNSAVTKLYYRNTAVTILKILSMKINRNYIQIPSPYRAVNTLRLSYKTNQSMLCSEIIALCSQIHTKHINTLCGQNVECRTYRAVNTPSQLQKPTS